MIGQGSITTTGLIGSQAVLPDHLVPPAGLHVEVGSRAGLCSQTGPLAMLCN